MRKAFLQKKSLRTKNIGSQSASARSGRHRGSKNIPRLEPGEMRGSLEGLDYGKRTGLYPLNTGYDARNPGPRPSAPLPAQGVNQAPIPGRTSDGVTYSKRRFNNALKERGLV